MKYPIGIQTFSEIREENLVYMDKTKEAYELINSYKYVFLSRPRRFGKSLFLDTLKNIFEGKKKYFKGLYIEDKYDFSINYPVVKISFAGDMASKESLNQVFNKILDYNQEMLKIDCDKKLDPSTCFDKLIREAFKKYNQRVVILIDEYDKPILDNITDKIMCEYARKKLKAFYEIMKDKDEFIKFVFITGVSKFSKVSLFSGFNNLTDITLNSKFGNICGYSQEDIEEKFREELKNTDLEEVKNWYDGYNFLKDKIYNPYDILLFVDNSCVFKNYWFETATPAFLIELIKQKDYYIPELENIILGEEILNSFDINNLSLEVILYQTGYLTIDEIIRLGAKILYKLKLPNKEVRMSLNDHIFQMFIDNPTKQAISQSEAYFALSSANLEKFKNSLISLFASLPYNNYAKNNINIYEGFYASVVYAFLSSLGLKQIPEDVTNKGRLDLTVFIEDKIYIIEFKTNRQNALLQIKEKKYYEKYLNLNRYIYLIGINFNTEEKNISDFEYKKI